MSKNGLIDPSTPILRRRTIRSEILRWAAAMALLFLLFCLSGLIRGWTDAF